MPIFGQIRMKTANFTPDLGMMEDISSEAASLAGHWQLSNLCWI